MAQKRKLSAADHSRIRNLFGPPPILEHENPREWEQLLGELYGDINPRDFVEETLVLDIAYSDWSIRRWRLIKTALVQAALPFAAAWVVGMPEEVRLRNLRDLQYNDLVVLAPSFKENFAKRRRQLRKLGSIESIEKAVREYQLEQNAITARAHLEEIELLDQIDRKIAIEQAQRNRAYREIQLHRAHIATERKNAARLIEVTDYEIVESKKDLAKKKVA